MSIQFFKRDRLADDVDGFFPLPTLYISKSKGNYFGIKIYFIGIIWLRFVRTTQIVVETQSKEREEK